MKMMQTLQTWLLITVMALSANTQVSAKVASGGINLSSELHQSLDESKSLNALGISNVSTIDASGSPLVPNGGRSKTIDIVEFRRTRNQDIIDELDQAAFGHVGISFNKGKSVYGFGPKGNGVDANSLIDRKSFAGRVTNDTKIFNDAKKLGLDVKITSISVTNRQYYLGKLQLFRDRVLGVRAGKRYQFPPRKGKDWGDDCMNCATYPESIGLPTTHPSGYLSK